MRHSPSRVGRSRWLAALAALTLTAGLAYAGPTNVRPVPVSGPGLQALLDSLHTGVGPAVDAVQDQKPYALFRPTASGGSIINLIASDPGPGAAYRFGIYDGLDPTNRALVFDSTDGPGSMSAVTYLASGDILVRFTPAAAGFSGSFGLWLETTTATSSEIVHSLDADNGSVTGPGAAHALVFEGNGETRIQIPGFRPGLWTGSEYLIAFEDSTSGDNSFDDFAIMMESIEPVPEPTSVALLGLGCAGLGAAGRRRRRRRRSHAS